MPVSPPSAVTEEKDIKNLLEKNLKWSQIIYEQNRRLQQAMTWMLIGNWIRLFILLVTVLFVIFFIGPTLRQIIF